MKCSYQVVMVAVILQCTSILKVCVYICVGRAGWRGWRGGQVGQVRRTGRSVGSVNHADRTGRSGRRARRVGRLGRWHQFPHKNVHVYMYIEIYGQIVLFHYGDCNRDTHHVMVFGINSLGYTFPCWPGFAHGPRPWPPLLWFPGFTHQIFKNACRVSLFNYFNTGCIYHCHTICLEECMGPGCIHRATVLYM